MKNNKNIAIVTGASTGLGKSISVKLGLKGYFVVLASRNEKKLNNVCEVIKKNGGNAQVVVTDISKEEEVKSLYSKINLSNVEVVVNNAGFGIFNKIQNVSLEEWDNQINTNLKGSFLISKYIVDKMIEKKSGKLIFINSVAGMNPYPYSSAYVASKYGLRGFASSLREELREHNIKVISVHPGAIDTPFWNKVKVDFPKDDMLKSNDVADSILHAIQTPNNLVQEEIIIRRTAGDF